MKQTVFEKVPVEKELPEKDSTYFVYWNGPYEQQDQIHVLGADWFSIKNNEFEESESMEPYSKTHYASPDGWLRELPDRMVLTEEELKEKMVGFARFCGDYIKVHGGWVHKFANQLDKNELRTDAELYHLWKRDKEEGK